MQIKNLEVVLSDERSLLEIVAQHLKISSKKIANIKILRKAIDARRRKGAEIKFIYTLEVNLNNKKIFSSTPAQPPRLEKNFLEKRHNKTEQKKIKPQIFLPPTHPEKSSAFRPVVVGFGPAGMFAALTLAKAGLAPIVFERGADVDARQAAVDKFFKTGDLDIKTNVQFGEGGAGTFSDGKLTTRLNDELIAEVIEIFIEAGAPEEIRYLQKPHIGTDKLRTVVKNIRQKIITLGGEVFFNAQITDIEVKSNKLNAVIVNNEQRVETDSLFLAIGHSARDTYEMLMNRGVEMEAKAFAIGVRIEHPQEFIDKAQYGIDFANPKLPHADYFLTFNPNNNPQKNSEFRIPHSALNRGAYTFCMCPGGQVVAATSELNQVVTNGMSNFLRDSGIANAALLATVSPADFVDFGRDALCGVRFQRKYEALAFELGGRNYCAPVQSIGDFLNSRSGSTQFLTTPSYPIGYKAVDLHDCLPNFVTATLEVALRSFDSKIKGFAADDVVMTGVETRTSAPCRILRNKEDYQSVGTKGLYPIGEGAGYAGGIMSSALDGMKAAISLINALRLEYEQ